MATQLDFSIVQNNADTITIYVYDKNDAPVDLTGMTLKWQLFDQNNVAKITKSSSQIAKVLGPENVTNGMGIGINPTDTINLPEGYYPHEGITVDGSSNPVTVTDNDPILSYGTGFIRRQLTRQP